MRQSKIDELIQQIELLATRKKDSTSEFDYWDYTIAKWNPIYIARSKEDEFIPRIVYNRLNGKKTNSPYSESKYLVLNGIVFRLSQHWGKCKTCYWPLANSVGEYHTESKLTLAYCRLCDFKQNEILKDYGDFIYELDTTAYKELWARIITKVK